MPNGQYITRQYTGIQQVTSGGGGGGGSVTFVQVGTDRLDYPTNVVAGHLLVIAAQWRSGSAGNLSSVTDTQGNSYTIVTASLSGGSSANVAFSGCQFAYAIALSSGPCTITTSYTSAIAEHVCVYELTAGSYDQTVVGNGTGTSISAGSITTANNGSFGITIASTDDGGGFGGGFTAGSGWTVDLNTGGGSFEQGSEHKVLTAAGPFTGDFTQSHSGTWYASFITFKP